MTLRRSTFLAFVLWLIAATAASATDWVTWTSFSSDVRRMREINDTVFVASSGGLLAVSNPNSEGRRYTNLNGLGTTNIMDIIEDADGQKWVAGYGRLIKFDGSASRRFIFADIENELFGLYCVEDDGNYIWVGTERGLVLFSKTIDGGLIPRQL